MLTIATIVTTSFQNAALAGLVNGGSDLVSQGTNAVLFDPTTPTVVINRYADNSLKNIDFIQIGFRTNNVAAFDVSAIAWSRDNVSYTPFAPSDSVSNIVAPLSYRLSSIVQLNEVADTPFYIRFTLPAGISPGSRVDSGFFGNSDGATIDGRLARVGFNTFLSLTRSHTAVPEPTSMLLVLSGAGWVVFRARRNRNKPAENAA